VKIKLFKLDINEVLASLKSYSKKIVEQGAKTVILIGSLARGDYTPFSDADILIISDNVPSSIPERVKKFLDPSLQIDVNPFVYTTREIIKMAKNRRKIIREILEYGKVLAGDEKIMEKIKQAFKEKETLNPKK